MASPRALPAPAPGAQVRTVGESEAALVFFDGRRFVVEAASSAAIAMEGVRAEAGSVRRLEPIPAVADIPPLARPGTRPGADRIRHEAGGGGAPFELYPRDAALLADAAVLRFAPVPGVERYRVEVIDDRGAEVFIAETAAKAVDVPAGRLAPGSVYYWRVTSRERGFHGGAFFVALSEAAAGARRRLTEQTTDRGDSRLDLLLAEVDRSLGLRREACKRLPNAARWTLDREPLERALEALECGESDRGLLPEPER